MSWQTLLLLVSLVVLTGGAELLVRGALALGHRMGLSPLFLGVTVVGFGTSTPELCTSLLAGVDGLDDIAVGNVVGSNTFNVAIILGTTAVLRPIAVRVAALRAELAMAIAAALVPFLALLSGCVMGRVHGVVLLCALVGYLRWSFVRNRVASETPPSADDGVSPAKRNPVARGILCVVAGLGLLVVGSHLLIESATRIAAQLGMSELAIGLTVVAAGTSAPELVTSLVAARRGAVDLALGNVLGSNVFNSFGILGLTCVLQPQAVRHQVLALDTPVMLLVSVALLPIASTGGRISRREGATLLFGYTAYVGVLLFWAPTWFGGR
ncbi:MAG: calcium/sodium antiporter [Planctomycetes bacterium]|nr:calcium/sodium antiporter [Planctomycetota bacterium]